MNRLIAIAINQYTDPQITDLKNCSNDVNAIIDILTQRYQFEKPELYSEKKATSLASIYNNLYNEFINALEEDTILIYFAGHGEYNEQLGASYWICSDSSRTNVTSWFNLDTLTSFFKASKAKHIALISDSCFSGAIFEQSRGGGSSALEGKLSRQALTSGGIEKVLDGEGEYSQFNLSLQNVLSKNHEQTLSFYQLSEQVILDFAQDARQTPEYGALHGAGHKGGTFILQLNDNSNSSIIQEIQLPLEMPEEINITGNVTLPFFNNNGRFNNSFVNSFIQGLGYSIINDLRNFALDDLQYAIERSKINEFEVEVNYSIEYFDEKYISLRFSHYSEMGGMHPNYYVYTLNFALSPDRKIRLEEILDLHDYQNLKEFLMAMIEQHAHPDDCEFLKECLTNHDHHDLPFSFTKEELTVYWFNLLPHAFKAHGELTFPYRVLTSS